MRESQMKKIIAAAVAAAFVMPVMAADVTLSGSAEFNMNDVNGTTTTATDTIFTVTASTETSNGLSVSADINVQSDDNTVAGDGSDSVTIAGPFGSVDLGDTSSAADKFDDRNDYSLLNGVATTAGDAAIGWTLPTLVEGATVYISHAADGGEGDKHTGVGIQYTAGPVTVAYAKNEEEAAESNLTYAGVSATFQGLTVSIESMEDEAGGVATADAKLDEDVIGAKYSMGDVTLFAANKETKEAGTKTEEISSYGLHYNLGGGVTFFIESSQDDLDDTADSTGAGIVMAF
jgi:hypothetical protein